MLRPRIDLPPEVLELVLVRLPVHVLCRFRLVCKRWNFLISQPRFAALCSKAPRRAPYVLISPKVMNVNPGAIDIYEILCELNLDPRDARMKVEPRRDWKILDMAEEQFYTLTDSFIGSYLRYRSTRREHFGWTKYTLAADGGLIYAMYFGGLTQTRRHIVCNPVSKTFHRILEPELRCKYNHDIVVMSVDPATQYYRIITMEAEIEATSRREHVYLYDSATTKWRNLCQVPAQYRACSSTFLEGVFYTLFLDLSMVPWCPKLYSCDLETGAWIFVDMELPQPFHLQDKSQLVVTLGRLFFVEYTGLPIFPYDHMTTWETVLAIDPVKRKQLIKVKIWEVLLDEKEVIKVAELPKYSKYPRRMLDRPQTVMGSPVVAHGCGNSIVISSVLGRRVDFDLRKNRWYELPENTGHMYATNRQGTYVPQGIYGGLLDLDLRKMKSS